MAEVECLPQLYYPKENHMSRQTADHSHIGQNIPVQYHSRMLWDNPRMLGFKQAIEKLLPAGGRAIELGAGTGVLSFFALQAGASKVWCIERDPQMAKICRELLNLNGYPDKAQVVEMDALDFMPSEPVDVVICEMLHSALLREKQVAVIDAFKRNYIQQFPNAKLPTFIPEATLLGVQPVEQNYNYHGYKAPLPMFYDPGESQNSTSKGLGDPVVYSVVEYRRELPLEFNFAQTISISQNGELNALRFVTKNLLAILLEAQTSIDWHNLYMILPLKQGIKVISGEQLMLKFSYRVGDSIDSLWDSIEVSKI